MRRPVIRQLLCLLLAVSCPQAWASCGSAFCSVNTSWDAQGVWMKQGTRLDLRYEYVHQDRLRSGSEDAAPEGIPGTHDELQTINRNLTLSAEHAWNEHWSLTLLAPLVARDHTHLFNDPLGTPEEEGWQMHEIGDLRLIGTWRSTRPQQARTCGARLGAKLPTGATDIANTEGERAERSLQPGTGTTDLIAGAFFSTQDAGPFSSWFVQATLQQPLFGTSDFRPGTLFGIDTGLSRRVGTQVNLLLQLNLYWRDRDGGTQAEPEESGHRMAAVSPGIDVAIARRTRLYGFVQLPLYQYVNSTQLVAERAFVLGLSRMF